MRPESISLGPRVRGDDGSCVLQFFAHVIPANAGTQ